MGAPLEFAALKKKIRDLLGEDINPEVFDDNAYLKAVNYAMREACRLKGYTRKAHGLTATAGVIDLTDDADTERFLLVEWVDL